MCCAPDGAHTERFQLAAPSCGLDPSAEPRPQKHARWRNHLWSGKHSDLQAGSR